MRYRRFVLIAAFASLVFPSSSGANSFGDDFIWDTDCSCILHGTHADIHFPDTDGTWLVTLNNFGIERVSAEYTDGHGGQGLIQAGGNITNHHQGDDCDFDSAGEIEAFIEHKRYPDGTYLCDVYGTPGLTGTHLYRVNRVDSCSGCWAGWVFNTKQPAQDVNFASARYVTAGGEVLTPSPSAIVVKATFGQNSGDTPWERTNDIYPTTASWTTIGSNAQCDFSSVWRVQKAPSPFQSQYLPGNPGCVS